MTESPARATTRLLPALPGVYRFRDQRGVAMYLGRATHLRARTSSYWGDLGRRPHLRRMVPQISRVEAVVCASVHEAAWLERNLLERGLLRWNRVRGGAEVPFWLVLDAQSGAPSLRALHQPVPGLANFGPYLGGERARALRQGLNRVWRLGLTGSRLGASELDLARARGVVATAADDMVAQVAAALSGDAAAVATWRTGLVAARDRAVEHLAFELAATITEELAALEWAVAPQRVTRSEQVQARVTGWCEGVAVEFDIVAGRMERWRQRELVREPVAALAATPDDWRDFAAENALLAARLLGRVPS